MTNGVPVSIDNNPRDDPKDQVLAGQIGKILTDNYPDWTWYVDIPPDQDIIIIRNLDLTASSTKRPWCMSTRKSKLSGGNLTVEIVRAGGELLERYERIKAHAGQFRYEDIAEKSNLTPET